MLGTLQGLFVADAEAYHSRIAQVHRVDVPEVLLFRFVKTLLCSCDACRTHHIDETIGVVVYESYALLTCLWGYHHYDAQVVAVGNGFHYLQIVVERQVWDDGTRGSALHATLAETFYSVVHDDVKVAHHHQRNSYLVFYLAQLLEKTGQSHSVFKCYGARCLYYRTVCQWVAERDAHLNHVDAPSLQCLYDVACAFERRTTGTEVQGEQFPSGLFLLFKKFVYLIHFKLYILNVFLI